MGRPRDRHPDAGRIRDLVAGRRAGLGLLGRPADTDGRWTAERLEPDGQGDGCTRDGGGAGEVGSGQLAPGVLVDKGRAEAAARNERERRGVVGSPVAVRIEIE